MTRTSERTLEELSAFLGVGLEAEVSARRAGWLQKRDARSKILALACFLLAVSLAQHVATLALLYAAGWGAAGLSHISSARLLRREWLAAFLFAGIVAIPVLFSGMSPGRPLLSLPAGLTVTEPGVYTALRIVLRAAASIHVVLLFTLTTPWPNVLRGLRGLGIPSTAVMVLHLTHRYLFLLIQTARDMLMSQECRRVGRLSGGMARRQLAASIGALLIRSSETATAVHGAMLARGYRGEQKSLSGGILRLADYTLVAGSALLAAAATVFDHAF